MKNIDFLPQRFHETVRRRRRNRRNVVLSMAIAASLTAMHVGNRSQLRSAQAALNALHSGTGSALGQQDLLTTLETRRQVLIRNADLLAALSDDAPLDAVVAQISRAMTESMALRSVSVERVTAHAETSSDDAAPTRPTTRVVLLAVAGTDVEVGIFFGRLSSCPLFQDVTLSFSRQAEYSGRQVRECELRFVVRRIETPS